SCLSYDVLPYDVLVSALFFCSFVSILCYFFFFFFSSRRRHTRCYRDWSSDVCSSDLRPRILASSATWSPLMKSSSGLMHVGMIRGRGGPMWPPAGGQTHRFARTRARGPVCVRR